MKLEIFGLHTAMSSSVFIESMEGCEKLRFSVRLTSFGILSFSRLSLPNPLDRHGELTSSLAER